MEQLHGGLTLEVPEGAFPLSTDSMVLSGFVRLPKDARVLDLGSGCGTLGVLLCGRFPGCHVTGVEIDPAAHRGALENIARNGLQSRMVSLCGDLRQLELPRGHFSVCVSNPPYFTGGPGSKTHGTARREDLCSLEDLMAAAERALKFGGDFYLVHRPERLGQICALGGRFGLEAKRLQLVRHREDGPVTLVLAQLRKGAKPGLAWEELSLHHSDGAPTKAYLNLYHL